MKKLQIQQRSSVDEVSTELGSKLTAANQNITELEHKLQVRGLLYIVYKLGFCTSNILWKLVAQVATYESYFYKLQVVQKWLHKLHLVQNLNL